MILHTFDLVVKLLSQGKETEKIHRQIKTNPFKYVFDGRLDSWLKSSTFHSHPLTEIFEALPAHMGKRLLLRSQHSRGKLENSIILEFHREKFWHCRRVLDPIYLKLCSKITITLLITPDYHPKPGMLIWLQKKSEASSVFSLCYANQHQRLSYFSSVPLANWKLICPVIFSPGETQEKCEFF